ncbi:MAG: hypothetical protein QM594_21395 [Niabella sp.]
MSIKIIITIAVVPLMLLAGYFTFRYLNNRLRSSRSTFSMVVYALLLFLSMAAIFSGGLTGMAMMYNYLTD